MSIPRRPAIYDGHDGCLVGHDWAEPLSRRGRRHSCEPSEASGGDEAGDDDASIGGFGAGQVEERGGGVSGQREQTAVCSTQSDVVSRLCLRGAAEAGPVVAVRCSPRSGCSGPRGTKKPRLAHLTPFDGEVGGLLLFLQSRVLVRWHCVWDVAFDQQTNGPAAQVEFYAAPRLPAHLPRAGKGNDDDDVCWQVPLCWGRGRTWLVQVGVGCCREWLCPREPTNGS
ncbi:uncharacterized protein B0I36DRAFT_105803 [Microdochium trichocladiopsis]|uniref:Uncharacterized protein n=1 Tax=Microdochium trichocladiopsis TaxID=1682393 RepID=A0A9P8YBP9_9PEZI|nr:uncharacterized protein B0I36DRAFT_105803 [Microdochium trichocladiopsis]KAH7033173.1 hypothetical protein B0I36DRAFT_105803 [Microdochium trichocladiopsis]